MCPPVIVIGAVGLVQFRNDPVTVVIAVGARRRGIVGAVGEAVGGRVVQCVAVSIPVLRIGNPIPIEVLSGEAQLIRYLGVGSGLETDGGGRMNAALAELPPLAPTYHAPDAVRARMSVPAPPAT